LRSLSSPLPKKNSIPKASDINEYCKNNALKKGERRDVDVVIFGEAIN